MRIMERIPVVLLSLPRILRVRMMVLMVMFSVRASLFGRLLLRLLISARKSGKMII